MSCKYILLSGVYSKFMVEILRLAASANHCFSFCEVDFQHSTVYAKGITSRIWD